MMPRRDGNKSHRDRAHPLRWYSRHAFAPDVVNGKPKECRWCGRRSQAHIEPDEERTLADVLESEE